MRMKPHCPNSGVVLKDALKLQLEGDHTVAGRLGVERGVVVKAVAFVGDIGLVGGGNPIGVGGVKSVDPAAGDVFAVE